MLLTEKVIVKWHGNNKKWFISKGYNFTRISDSFEVLVQDLPIGSHTIIETLCDYCNSSKVTKEWKRYIRDIVNSVVKKDCCTSCQPIKTKECNLIKYGVESKTELKETQDKIKKTMIDKYGVDHNMKNKEIRDKTVNTYIKKYGVDNPMKNREIINKSNESKIKRFGSTNPFTHEEVMDKAKKTNLKKYGTEWHMQNDEVMIKSKTSMYRNGTTPCSRQQQYLYELLGGKLNFPISRASLDIAFPDEKIYIEYDGNGHNLSVKLGNVTEEEFKTKEIKRYLFLKSMGWKQIKIVSPVDYLPSDIVIINEINKAKEWLKGNEKGHWHYIIEIGDKINDKNFGVVRRIIEDDLKGVMPC